MGEVVMADIYFDYRKMMTEINNYAEKYSFLSLTGVSQTILGKNIPALIFGEGKSVIVYVGGEDGCDNISSFALLRFVRDICALYKEGGSAFGFSAENIFKSYTLIIIPMLNPDGYCYCSEGVKIDNPLRDRVLKLNNGSDDFSCWRGNARGVELKYNYSFEYSENEPEPEAGALCNLLRYGYKPDMLIDFSQSAEKAGAVYYGEGETENRMAIALSQMCGMKREYRESQAPRLMLADWALRELSSSAFLVELPRVEGYGIKALEDKAFSCYSRIRKLLFCAPFLNKIK